MELDAMTGQIPAAAGPTAAVVPSADPLPRSQLLRVAKAALPEGYRLDDRAKLAVSKSVTAFVLCATCHALDAAKVNKRATISKQDILTAMEELGLEHFLPQLESVSAAKKPKAAPKPAADEELSAHSLAGQPVARPDQLGAAKPQNAEAVDAMEVEAEQADVDPADQAP
jgi:histone H3/H4|uniref:Transcription factor CBF/NF-Y/archaeal histone domain-containing protein n=1 Tax=Eutreptiella gymnastica TaxID=73025 RepID=A0A7S4LCX6_9EUGL